MMNRRRFLEVVQAASVLSVTRPFHVLAQPFHARLALEVHENDVIAQVPEGFVGLSYESQQLSDPTFFSAENHELQPFFRTLSANGVLRLGGNTSANSWWKPTEASIRPEFKNYRHVVQDGVPSDKLAYAITPQAVVNLRAFLDAVGWRVIYGLNLANGTPGAVAEEAAFVAKTLGEKLLYFQVGNEVDLFERSVRPLGWTPDQYFAEWLTFARAVVQRVPDARFSAPDVATKPEWITRFAELLAATKDAPHVAAITHHYYAGGPPSDPRLTRARLLSVDPRVANEGSAAVVAAKAIGAKVRLTEGNTCYHGGKPGVSDVFASTLWAAEYALTLASMGYSGINLHGGGGRQVADSLGGKLPGEALLPRGSGWHPSPFYTPIASGPHGGFVAEPIYYGLLLADYFADCSLLKAKIRSAPEGMRVFAAKGASQRARLGGATRVALINRTDQDFRIKLRTTGGAQYEELTAPGLDAKEARFGNGGVTTNGILTGAASSKSDNGEVVVRKQSALLAWWT